MFTDIFRGVDVIFECFVSMFKHLENKENHKDDNIFIENVAPVII